MLGARGIRARTAPTCRPTALLLAAAAGLTLLTAGPGLAASRAAKPSPPAAPPAAPKASPPVTVPLPDSAGSTTPGSATPEVVTFGVRPAQTSGTDDRAFFIFSATPSTTIPDHAAVVNYSLKPITLQLYTTDGLSAPDGSFGLLTAAQKPRDAGAWVTIQGPSHITVPARSETILPIVLQVPGNASPGDHVGGVVASLNVVSKDAKGENIELQQRIAARVYVRVAGPVHPGIAVTDVRVRYKASLFGAGKTDVTWTLRNTGNIVLGGHQRLKVSGWFGIGKTVTVADLADLLLPGAVVTQSATVSGILPAVRLTATVQVDPLHLPDQTLGTLPIYSGSGSTWAFPWIVLLAIAVIVGLVLLWRWRRRRFARAVAAAHAVRPSDTKTKAPVA